MPTILPKTAAQLALVVSVTLVGLVQAERFVLVGSWTSGDVRRYRTDGTFVDTFIPAKSGGLAFPDGLAYGPDGDLYVSDAPNARVLQYDGSTGAYKKVFATTNITRAGYCAFGPDGNFYVCSNGDNKVHRFNASTGAYIDAFAFASNMSYPAGLTWHGGNLYVSGFGSGVIDRFDQNTGAFVDTLATGLRGPLYTRFGSDGDLYISEYRANRLDRFNITTKSIVGTISGNGLLGPVGQLAKPDGSLLVTTWNNGNVLRYNESNGAFLGTFSTGYPQGNDILLTPDIAPAPGSTLVFLGAAAVGMRRRRSPVPSTPGSLT